jgi:tRNA modification GTPase
MLILVRTKSDLALDAVNLESLGKELGAASWAEVSAETGGGVQQLLKTIGDCLATEIGAPELDAPILTQTRHRAGVTRALDELRDFRRAWRDEKLPATVAAVHLHAAADALHDLIGGIDTEQVLDEVFRRFCVGK